MAQKQRQTTTSYYIPSSQQSTGSQQPARVPGSGNKPLSQPQTRSWIARTWQQLHGTLRGQFLAHAGLIFLLALSLAVAVSQSFSRASDDLNTIASGSIPSVDAAQAMAQYIEDIDARSADYLATAALTQDEPCYIVGDKSGSSRMLTIHDCDDRNIDTEIILLNSSLFEATHNVSYPGERTAIDRITAGIEEYIADISEMRYEYQQVPNKADIQNIHMQNAYKAYLAATNVLHAHINLQPTTSSTGDIAFNEPEASIPDCAVNGQKLSPRQWVVMGSIEDNITCLNTINKDHLDTAYNDTVGFLGFNTLLYGGLCLVLCILLAVLTIRMIVITHRIINLGLTLALLAGIVFSIFAVGLFADMSGRHGAYGQMVKDDYDSIYYAAQLKHYGTAANADESRWLIALAFNDQSQVERWATDWQSNTAQVRQLIQRAHTNRTWPEEDQPLADISSGWSNYFAIDGQIRAAANKTSDKNHIANAELLSTGDSNRAFGKFSDAVDALGAANRLHYNATLASTQQALQLYFWLSVLLFPLIGLATIWGVTSRLKDF
jgi:hypothetical protein